MRGLFFRVWLSLAILLLGSVAMGSALAPFLELPGGPGGSARVLVASAVSLAALGFGVYVLVRPLERRLAAITEAARRLGRGELEARSGVDSGDAAGELATAFDAMAGRVEKMVEGRKMLLHGVSHELRTPLARLRFALELLEGARDDAERSRRVREALGDVEELEGLVSELLRFSELEDGPSTLQLARTEAGPFIDNVVEEARRLRRGQVEIAYEREELPRVMADRRHLHRALTNLMTNAVRYADHRVRVTARLGGDGLSFQVEDDGPGVPEAERDRIFEPFVRLDAARSRDTGGAGLGLAIARRAIEAHGGTLSVETGDLGGARFVLELPRAPGR